MHLTMKSWAVIVVVALFAVTLAVLVVPSISWAAVQEWLTAPTSIPCECLGQ
jgi:hypothetical protein